MKKTEFKQQLFFNKNLQQSFAANGFVSFPLLDAQTCDYLKDCYEDLKALHLLKGNEKFHSTAHSNNWELIEEVNNLSSTDKCNRLKLFYGRSET